MTPSQLSGEGSQLARDAASIVQRTTHCSVTNVSWISRGMMTHKFIVEASTQKYIVRFYPADRSFVVDYEPDTLRRLRISGLPVPEVLADSRTGPPALLGYMLYPMIPGMTLAERLASATPFLPDRCCERLVQCLSQLGRIHFEGAGELVTALKGGATTWRVFVRESYMEGLKAIENHGFLTTDTVQSLKSIAYFCDYISDGSTSDFIWGDPTAQNILVNEHGDLAGLIDFESVLAGDPLATLGNLYAAHSHDVFFQAVIDLWPQPLQGDPWRRVLFYAILRTMRVAKFAHLPLPTGKPRAPLAEIFPNFLRAISEFQSLS